jgi:hypothetical protein
MLHGLHLPSPKLGGKACAHKHKKTSIMRVRVQASDMSNMCTGAERIVTNGFIPLVGGTSIETLTCGDGTVAVTWLTDTDKPRLHIEAAAM